MSYAQELDALVVSHHDSKQTAHHTAAHGDATRLRSSTTTRSACRHGHLRRIRLRVMLIAHLHKHFSAFFHNFSVHCWFVLFSAAHTPKSCSTHFAVRTPKIDQSRPSSWWVGSSPVATRSLSVLRFLLRAHRLLCINVTLMRLTLILAMEMRIALFADDV